MCLMSSFSARGKPWKRPHCFTLPGIEILEDCRREWESGLRPEPSIEGHRFSATFLNYIFLIFYDKPHVAYNVSGALFAFRSFWHIFRFDIRRAKVPNWGTHGASFCKLAWVL